MRRVIKYYALLILIVFACCNPLEEIATIPPPKVETISISKISSDSVLVTGQVIEKGDGVEEYGFVWSTTRQRPDLGDNDNLMVNTIIPTGNTFSFSHKISIASSNDLYVRAYLKDKHHAPPQRLAFYGEPLSVSGATIKAAFSIDRLDNPCIAPCTLRFIDASTDANRHEWRINGVLKSIKPIFDQVFDQPGFYNIELSVFAANNIDTDIASERVVIDGITFGTIPCFQCSNYGPGQKIIEIEDGYAILSTEGTKIAFVKMSKTGEVLSQSQSYNPIHLGMNNRDIGKDMIRLSSSDFFIVGSTPNIRMNDPTSGDKDIFYLQIDAAGNIKNEPDTIRLRTGSDGVAEIANKVIQTADGSLVITGSRTDTSGGHSFIHKRNFVQNSIDFETIANDFEAHTINSGIEMQESSQLLFVGETKGELKDIITIITDKQGNISRPLQRIQSTNNDRIIAIKSAPNNKYVAAGGSYNTILNKEFAYLLFFNANGVQTDSLLISNAEGDILCTSLVVLEDESMVLAGDKIKNGNYVGYIQKIDKNGITQWLHDSFGADIINDIQQTTDKGFVLTGVKGGRLYVAKTNSEGKIN